MPVTGPLSRSGQRWEWDSTLLSPAFAEDGRGCESSIDVLPAMNGGDSRAATPRLGCFLLDRPEPPQWWEDLPGLQTDDGVLGRMSPTRAEVRRLHPRCGS